MFSVDYVKGTPNKIVKGDLDGFISDKDALIKELQDRVAELEAQLQDIQSKTEDSRSLTETYFSSQSQTINPSPNYSYMKKVVINKTVSADYIITPSTDGTTVPVSSIPICNNIKTPALQNMVLSIDSFEAGIKKQVNVQPFSGGGNVRLTIQPKESLPIITRYGFSSNGNTYYSTTINYNENGGTIRHMSILGKTFNAYTLYFPRKRMLVFIVLKSGKSINIDQPYYELASGNSNANWDNVDRVSHIFEIGGISYNLTGSSTHPIIKATKYSIFSPISVIDDTFQMTLLPSKYFQETLPDYRTGVTPLAYIGDVDLTQVYLLTDMPLTPIYKQDDTNTSLIINL